MHGYKVSHVQYVWHAALCTPLVTKENSVLELMPKAMNATLESKRFGPRVGGSCEGIDNYFILYLNYLSFK